MRISRWLARPQFLRASVGVVVAGLLGCSNAGEDLGFEPLGAGTVAAFFYLDRDGNLAPSAGADTAYAGVRIALVVAGTTDTAFSAQTDALGNVVFNEIPFGDYRLVVDPSTVGDSLQVQAVDSANVRLRADRTQQLVTIRLGFPALTVAQARTAAAGIRAFVQGLLLAGPGTYGDTTAYIIENGVAIRLNQAFNAGLASQPGDSVRVLGTVATRSGQPVLTDAAISVFFLGQTNPAPTPLTTQLANNADTAAQDAALVQLTGGVITDTLTVGNDLHVGLDDGSGKVYMALDGDINFNATLFAPAKTVAGMGILVPSNTGTWLFKPRVPADITVN
jgi:hypothetical protein